MKLIGKTREDFEKYLKENYNHLLVRTGDDKTYLYDLLLSSHIKKTNGLLTHTIIEWFDTVNLQITIEAIQGGEFRCYVLDNKFSHYWIEDRFDSRQKAISEAIIKANELYNESK